MNRHYAVLLAILLPFSGYGMTKEGRMNEINEKAHRLTVEAMTEWITFLYSLYYVQLSISMLPKEEPEEFKKNAQEYMNKMTELEKEFNELKEQA